MLNPILSLALALTTQAETIKTGSLAPTAKLFAMGNGIRPEPGTIRGCTWSGWGPGPAPDIVSDSEEKARATQYDKGVTIKVVARKKSPYFVKGFVSDQDPPPCAKWPSASREVKLTISSGKTEPEAAFVEVPGKGYFPYSEKDFGKPSMATGECLSAKGLRVFDIGTQITKKYFDEEACEIGARGYRPIHFNQNNLKITMSILGNSSGIIPRDAKDKTRRDTYAIQLKIDFEGPKSEEIQILFSSGVSTYLHPVAPGFKLTKLSEQPGVASGLFQGDAANRGRFIKNVGRGTVYSVYGNLLVSPDVKAGEHWLTFAFKNLRTEDFYNVSEPVKIKVEP